MLVTMMAPESIEAKNVPGDGYDQHPTGETDQGDCGRQR